MHHVAEQADQSGPAQPGPEESDGPAMVADGQFGSGQSGQWCQWFSFQGLVQGLSDRLAVGQPQDEFGLYAQGGEVIRKG